MRTRGPEEALPSGFYEKGLQAQTEKNGIAPANFADRSAFPVYERTGAGGVSSSPPPSISRTA